MASIIAACELVTLPAQPAMLDCSNVIDGKHTMTVATSACSKDSANQMTLQMTTPSRFNYSTLLQAIADDLHQVSTSAPNERLPKEEQIRSRVFAELLPQARITCVERGYGSVDERSSTEVDIWSSWHQGHDHWLEIKRCWHVSGSGWNNKAGEQLNTWIADIKKLSTAPIQDYRAFLLVGFFDLDPSSVEARTGNAVIRSIANIQPNKLVAANSNAFSWRGSRVSYLGMWIWEWKPMDFIDFDHIVQTPTNNTTP